MEINGAPLTLLNLPTEIILLILSFVANGRYVRSNHLFECPTGMMTCEIPPTSSLGILRYRTVSKTMSTLCLQSLTDLCLYREECKGYDSDDSASFDSEYTQVGYPAIIPLRTLAIFLAHPLKLKYIRNLFWDASSHEDNLRLCSMLCQCTSLDQLNMKVENIFDRLLAYQFGWTNLGFAKSMTSFYHEFVELSQKKTFFSGVDISISCDDGWALRKNEGIFDELAWEDERVEETFAFKMFQIVDSLIVENPDAFINYFPNLERITFNDFTIFPNWQVPVINDNDDDDDDDDDDEKVDYVEVSSWNLK